MAIDPLALSLTDRVAVVTGAAMGIGEATARMLAQHGARIAICDRDQAALDLTTAALRQHGADVYSEALDVRDAPAVSSFVANTVERLAAASPGGHGRSA